MSTRILYCTYAYAYCTARVSSESIMRDDMLIRWSVTDLLYQYK